MRDIPIFDNKIINAPLGITNMNIKTKAAFSHSIWNWKWLEKLKKEPREKIYIINLKDSGFSL